MGIAAFLKKREIQTVASYKTSNGISSFSKEMQDSTVANYKTSKESSGLALD